MLQTQNSTVSVAPIVRVDTIAANAAKAGDGNKTQPNGSCVDCGGQIPAEPLSRPGQCRCGFCESQRWGW